MAIEQQTPGAFQDPIDALGPFTENELCKPVAVKLIHKQLADLRETNASLISQVQTERNRADAMGTRANTAETELRVANSTLQFRNKRGLVVRLLEFVIIVLIEFSIAAAKSAEWKSLAVLCVTTLVLVGVIVIIEWPQAVSEKP